jgi:hypothetical protein
MENGNNEPAKCSFQFYTKTNFEATCMRSYLPRGKVPHVDYLVSPHLGKNCRRKLVEMKTIYTSFHKQKNPHSARKEMKPRNVCLRNCSAWCGTLHRILETQAARIYENLHLITFIS